MLRAFDRSIFDEPDSVNASAVAKKHKVAPTFVIDLMVSALYVIAVLPSWRDSITHGLIVIIPSAAIGFAIFVCYIGKIVIVCYLDRRGGDARAYVKSSVLVTDGPYRWSRHPTYAVAMLQFVLWSILAIYVQLFVSWNLVMMGAALALPVGFYIINDCIVMPVEEAMLRTLHCEEFDSYASRVRRWFGRNAVTGVLQSTDRARGID